MVKQMLVAVEFVGSHHEIVVSSLWWGNFCIWKSCYKEINKQTTSESKESNIYIFKQGRFDWPISNLKHQSHFQDLLALSERALDTNVENRLGSVKIKKGIFYNNHIAE